MNTKRSFRLSASALSLIAVFTLTACANPIEQMMQNGAESALEKLIEQESGANVDLNIDGEGGFSVQGEDGENFTSGSDAEVPDNWPGLPLPEGKLIMVATKDDVISLSYTTTEAALSKLLSDLERAGFSIDESSEMTGMKIYVLTDAENRSVSVSGLSDGGQVQLQYIVGS